MSIDRNDLIGKTLKGKYTIEREIGNGGMGVVYLAQQAIPSRKVAIKFLLLSRPVDNEAYNELLIRFRREVRIIKNLSHENIMPIFDSGKLYEGAYFVMPYIKLTLQKNLEDDGALSAYETLLYIEQATAALDYAHSRGIIHRDLKPLNFLLTADRKLILTDFGIARIAGSTLTQIGTFIGTEYYAAPEVKRGEPDIDLRADIYSLGVVLAVMLTAKDPWLINYEQATNLPALDAVIRKATKQNRRDRFQTAGELAQALRAAVEGEHSAPTLIQPDQPEPPRRQRPGLWIAGIVIVFVIIIFGIWATTQNNDQGGIFISPHHPSVQPENPAIKQAEAAVNEYYSDWNRKNYAAAYNLLDPGWRNLRGNTLEDLKFSYEHTQHICITINSATLQSDGSVNVEVTDNAVEDNAQKSGTVTRIYHGHFQAKLEQGSWKLIPYFGHGTENGVCKY